MNGMVSSIGVWMVPGLALAAPGDHIRAGEMVIVPDINLGAEYRTNVYRNEDAGVPAANVHVKPGVSATLEGEDHGFKSNGEWTLRKFFFVGESDLLSAETPDRVTNLDRIDEFSLAAGIDTFKRSVVGLRLDDNLSRQNWTADAEYADLPYSSQFRNTLDGGVRINPGPALEFLPGASWTYDSYQVPRLGGEDGERALNKRHTYGPSLNVRWAFLPRTSLVLASTYTWYRWQQNVLESNGADAGSEIALPDSESLKLWSGIDGRFTEKLFLQFMVGYGSAVYDPDSAPVVETTPDAEISVSGLRKLLINSQIRFDITPSTERRPGTKVSVGYIRDFRDILLHQLRRPRPDLRSLRRPVRRAAAHRQVRASDRGLPGRGQPERHRQPPRRRCGVLVPVLRVGLGRGDVAAAGIRCGQRRIRRRQPAPGRDLLLLASGMAGSPEPRLGSSGGAVIP